MNFFRGKNESIEYMNSNELDPDSVYSLNLEMAKDVAKKIFYSEIGIR